MLDARQPLTHPPRTRCARCTWRRRSSRRRGGGHRRRAARENLLHIAVGAALVVSFGSRDRPGAARGERVASLRTRSDDDGARGAMVECETRTQGARIAALFARPRTRDRADQCGPSCPRSLSRCEFCKVPARGKVLHAAGDRQGRGEVGLPARLTTQGAGHATRAPHPNEAGIRAGGCTRRTPRRRLGTAGGRQREQRKTDAGDVPTISGSAAARGTGSRRPSSSSGIGRRHHRIRLPSDQRRHGEDLHADDPRHRPHAPRGGNGEVRMHPPRRRPRRLGRTSERMSAGHARSRSPD